MDWHLLALLAVPLLAAPRAIAALRDRLRRGRNVRAATAFTLHEIASAPEGRCVRIVGEVAEPAQALIAPCTRRRCVAYRATIEVRSDDRTDLWAAVADERDAVDFAMTDATGRAIVDAGTVALQLETGQRVGPFGSHTLRAETSARVTAAIRARPYASQFRYREEALEIGDRIALVGVGVREPDPDASAAVTGYREGPPTRLRIGGTGAQRGFITDDERALR